MPKTLTFNDARIVIKNGTEANWDKTNYIPMACEPIIYNPDTTHLLFRFKIGDGKTQVKDLPFQKTGVSPEDLEHVAAERLKHSLTFGMGSQNYTFDGSADVTVPVYIGKYSAN